jgi:hypothetical protein
LDPQIFVTQPDGASKKELLQITTDEIKHYFDFIRTDLEIKDPVHLSSAFAALADSVGHLSIGTSKRSQNLAFSLSVRMLKTHMDNETDRADSIARALTSEYFDHSYAISRREAMEIGLNITIPKPELETIMWDI